MGIIKVLNGFFYIGRVLINFVPIGCNNNEEECLHSQTVRICYFSIIGRWYGCT